MLLWIVHPGGHVELHDRPVPAAEIMYRNPRCCVAHPCVFQQPWAIVAPDTMLMLGQKFYVVPINTIRKLQRLSPMSSPSPARKIKISSFVDEIRNIQIGKEEEDDGLISTCCVFRNKSITKESYNGKKPLRNISKKSEIRSDVRNSNLNVNDKNEGLSHDNCFACLFSGVLTKANVSDMTKQTGPSLSSNGLCDSISLTRRRTQDLNGNGLRGSPNKVWSSEHWQPSLESITEE